MKMVLNVPENSLKRYQRNDIQVWLELTEGLSKHWQFELHFDYGHDSAERE